MIRPVIFAASLACVGAPAAACDLTPVVIDTFAAPAPERDNAITDCIAGGGDPNEAIEGFAVLTLVVSHSNVFGVNALLDAGADPNLRDGDGRSALAMAATLPDPAQRLAILENLVAAGADLNVEDSTEFTPLSYAVATGEPADFIADLLRLGADPTLPNSQGETALAFMTPGICAADTGQHLLDAGARLDDMAPSTAAFVSARASENCTNTPAQLAFLNNLLKTAS